MKFTNCKNLFILLSFFWLFATSCALKSNSASPLRDTKWRIAKVEREKENDPVKDSVFSGYDKELETMVYAFGDSSCTVFFRGHEEKADYQVNGIDLVFSYGLKKDTSKIISHTPDSLILQLSPKLRARMVKVR
jgi:hypothetical protein